MSEWKILHNPRCSKSRETLKILEEAGIKPLVVEYLKKPLTKSEIKILISQLKDLSAKDLVRTKEDLYKDLQFNLDSEDTVAEFLSKHPTLLERPVVIKNDQAVIGRPPEKVRVLF